LGKSTSIVVGSGAIISFEERVAINMLRIAAVKIIKQAYTRYLI